MVEEIATVTSSEKNGVWLTSTPVTSCNACNVNSDCGTGVVAKTLTPKDLHFFVPTSLHLMPGEQVKIGVSEQSLVMAALMVYLVPLVLMIVCSLIASVMNLSEGLIILLAALGGAFGFYIAKCYGKYQEKHTHIVILEVLPTVGVQLKTI